MTPANERKAKERQAKRDAGLVRVEVWVRPEHAELVKGYAFGLRDISSVMASLAAVKESTKTATEIVEMEKNRLPLQAAYKRCSHCHGRGWQYSGDLMKPVGDGQPCPYCVGGYAK